MTFKCRGEWMRWANKPVPQIRDAALVQPFCWSAAWSRHWLRGGCAVIRGYGTGGGGDVDVGHDIEGSGSRRVRSRHWLYIMPINIGA
ncbi:hypothetical protein PIB30_071607 [Stylosanthes scabra]|uniref:Uncharacterized protein n=1 Tax=Stylosanthes scabra TaxID=79078 RepID=A0ABU6UMP6_9FABA|nr:hypothetical protein [Stylosanthes scabra]